MTMTAGLAGGEGGALAGCATAPPMPATKTRAVTMNRTDRVILAPVVCAIDGRYTHELRFVSGVGDQLAVKNSISRGDAEKRRSIDHCPPLSPRLCVNRQPRTVN